MAGGSSSVVEHYYHFPKVEGLSPAHTDVTILSLSQDYGNIASIDSTVVENYSHFPKVERFESTSHG